MSFTVRRLGPDDAPALVRSESLEDPAAARAFLADPTVLVWLAEAAGEPVGMLHCCVVRLATGACELLIYDIGTEEPWRRRGVGRGLLLAMEGWMREHGVEEAWVPSGTEAVGFYAACGFAVDDGVILTRTVA